MNELDQLRDLIDRSDQALLRALAERMSGVAEIASVKAALGLGVLDEERERAVLADAARSAAEHGLDPAVAQRVLREIIAISRELQERRLRGESPVRASFQGAPGAFSWIAARAHFGEATETIGHATFAGALDAVAHSVVDFAVVPVENTLAGSIHEVLDEMATRSLHVVGEEIVHIDHCLIGLEPVALDAIRLVLSHPVALAQCTRFLRGLPAAECRAFVDTAEAVTRVADDGDPSHVAIASHQAARLRGLRVLATGLADHPENYTRFWIIAREPTEVAEDVPARTSLLLVTDHRDGALVAALQSLAEQGVNMTRLESRPIRGVPWQYSFFIDCEGNTAEPRVRAALDGMRRHARVLRVLGCYPQRQGA